MRTIKKILSSMLALAMLVGVFAPYTAFAEDLTSKDPNAVTKTVTLHKLVMSKQELIEWPETPSYDGTQDISALKNLNELRGKTVKEVAGVYFALKFADDYADADKRGKYVKKGDDSLTPKMPLEATDKIEEAVGGLTEDTGVVFKTQQLKGSFLIDEVSSKSTYKGENGESLAGSKAVPVKITLPLVNKDGTVLNAHVYPKNTQDKPEIDKNFAKQEGSEYGDFYDNLKPDEKDALGADYAKYQLDKMEVSQTVGTKVPYEVKTKVKSGTEYGKLVWKDSMTNGLTFNQDLKISANNGVDLTQSDYKITQDGRGFTLSLTKEGLDKVKAVTKPGKNDGNDVEFTLKYSATLNGTAVVDVPEKNNIYLEYGHRPDNEIEENPVKPKDGSLTVTKNWADGQDVPDDVFVTYVLKKGNDVKSSVTLNKNMTSGTLDLGNGIKFEITSAFNGKFTGLAEGDDWKISERVAGYTPSYTKPSDDGTVTITNTKDNDNPPPLNPTEPKVVVGGKKFVKTDEADVRLAGAKFVVKKDNKYLASKSDAEKTSEQTALEEAKTKLNEAVNKYNSRADDNNKANLEKEVTDAQKAYNDAFHKASIKYEWIDSKDADNVVVLVSNDKGQFEVSGLEYGDYLLEEIEAPKGFAKITDIEFKVAKAGAESIMNIKYTDGVGDSNDAQKVVNKKVTIPQTGGIGTIIFTVAGLALMLGAAYAIKKNREEA
ncbi:pilin N-terminal domain-containing protein [Peptostreptococcus porci]|uniref:pilin N-terminal domain-containing protein n=1 Tax=Peptostreptococcus porci TaxID=2652282 RepID=UPI002A761C4B|nr:pilin N-terminal domain-containing protein [Peptostreptococcus porci]MDY2795415.1 pilin N-terminal domain-containing protein [Peptostreptococcus porci]